MREEYRNIPDSGVALGGIGTGSVEIRGDGRFHNWQIMNNVPWTPGAPTERQDNSFAGGKTVRGSQAMSTEGLIFLLWARPRKGGTPQMRVLALDNNPLNSNKYHMAYLRTPGRIVFRGEFPKTIVEYRELGLPLEVTGTFVSPFVPGDEAKSATPGFYADFEVGGAGRDEWEASITAILTNGTSWDRPDLPKANELRKNPKAVSVYMTTPGADPEAPSTGTMCIAAEGRAVSYLAGYYWANVKHGSLDRRHAFRDLYDTGRFPDWPYGNEPERFPARFKLEDLDEAQRKRFLRTCREHYDLAQFERYVKEYGAGPASEVEANSWAGDFDKRSDLLSRQRRWGMAWGGALSVSGKASKARALEARFVVGWHFPNHIVYDKRRSQCCGKGETLARRVGHEYAKRFRDAAEVVEALVAKPREYHAPTVEFHDALYTGTIDEKTKDQISAQLDNLVRASWWTEDNGFGLWEGMDCCGLNTTDVAYYASVPLAILFPKLSEYERELTRRDQHENGRVPHLFPFTFDHPDDQWYRTDMMAEYVLMVYRDYLWTGDRALLGKFYSSCVRAMRAMAETDRDENGLPDALGADTTYDQWGMFGTTAFMSGLYLSGLEALAAMADVMGDVETARDARERFERGRNAFEKELWNGEYYRLWHRVREDDADEGCMADQLAGQWYSKMLGLPGYVDDARAKKALKSIFKYNFIPGRGLVNGNYPQGAKPPAAFFINYMVSEVWSGTEYTVASMMLYYGLEKEAEAILADIHARYANSAGLWRHDECGTYYYRPLSAWAVLMGSQGLRWNAPDGHLQLLNAAAGHESALCVPGFWGMLKRGKRCVTLSARGGRMAVRRLTVRAGRPDGQPSATLGGRAVAIAASARQGGHVTVEFGRPVVITDRKALVVRV